MPIAQEDLNIFPCIQNRRTPCETCANHKNRLFIHNSIPMALSTKANLGRPLIEDVNRILKYFLLLRYISNWRVIHLDANEGLGNYLQNLSTAFWTRVSATA